MDQRWCTGSIHLTVEIHWSFVCSPGQLLGHLASPNANNNFSASVGMIGCAHARDAEVLAWESCCPNVGTRDICNVYLLNCGSAGYARPVLLKSAAAKRLHFALEHRSKA